MEVNTYELLPNPRIFALANDDDVYLSVQIGNGQIGGNKVSADDAVLAKGNLSQSTFLGKAGNLMDHEITIATNVLDVNTFTNVCVITTTFRNQNDQVLYAKIDQGEAPENGIARFIGKYAIRPLMIVVLMLSGYVGARCQLIDFDDLQTPASPGLILFDKTPAVIERPTTPQGLATYMLGFFQGGAFEVAPFWLKQHPELTAEKMHNNRVPVLYNLSFSAATVFADDTRNMSAGIRTRIFQDYGTRLTLLNSLKGAIEEALVDPASFDKIPALQKEYMDLVAKPVFNIDIAGAIGGNSPIDDDRSLDINRWGVWTSLNWRPKGDDFYLTALARYMYNVSYEQEAMETGLIDTGVRLNYDIANICIGVEGLKRYTTRSSAYEGGFRLVFIGNYRISDTLYLTGAFGKNFAETGNLISMLGMNVGFSKNKIKLD